MRVKLIEPANKYWLKLPAYRLMVKDRTIEARSWYRAERASYRNLLAAELGRGGLKALRVETVMVCGVGDSVEEAELLAEYFPGTREIHLVDWHRPNLDGFLRRLQQSPLAGSALDLFLHHADLRNPETVAGGSIHFAFANKLLDLYKHDSPQLLCLTGGISQCLVNGGVFYSMDFPRLPVEEDHFYPIAAEVGLSRVAERILRYEPEPAATPLPEAPAEPAPAQSLDHFGKLFELANAQMRLEEMAQLDRSATETFVVYDGLKAQLLKSLRRIDQDYARAMEITLEIEEMISRPSAGGSRRYELTDELRLLQPDLADDLDDFIVLWQIAKEHSGQQGKMRETAEAFAEYSRNPEKMGLFARLLPGSGIGNEKRTIVLARWILMSMKGLLEE